MNNNTPSFTDLELLTSLLREEIEASGEMKKAEISFLFDDIYIKSVENTTATVAVPTLYMREYYIRNKIDKKIEKHLSHMLGMEITVEIFVDGSRVASHARDRSLPKGWHVTDPSHRHPDHDAWVSHDSGWFRQKAKGVGPACLQVVNGFLEAGVAEEQGWG